MSKMRFLMLGLAVGSAAIAGVLAKGFIGKKPKTEKEIVTQIETKDVLFASADLQIGEKLGPGTLMWKAFPITNLQDVMITKDEMPDAEKDLAEARAAVPIYNGEPLNERKYVKSGDRGFMSAILPKGMRAISLAISSRSSAGGFVLPNDRVDVLLTKKIGELVKSETVISNVRVLAINQVLRRVQDGDSVAMKEVETATFELPPFMAEILAKVETEGELTLVLRSIAEGDNVAAEQEGPQLAEKFKGGNKKRGSDTVFIRAGIETYATNP